MLSCCLARTGLAKTQNSKTRTPKNSHPRTPHHENSDSSVSRKLRTPKSFVTVFCSLLYLTNNTTALKRLPPAGSVWGFLTIIAVSEICTEGKLFAFREVHVLNLVLVLQSKAPYVCIVAPTGVYCAFQ